MSTRYFLALDGVKGDSLNSTYKGWFELSNFDIALAGAGAGPAAFSPLTLRWTAIPDWRRCWLWRRRATTSMVRRWSV